MKTLSFFGFLAVVALPRTLFWISSFFVSFFVAGFAFCLLALRFVGVVDLPNVWEFWDCLLVFILSKSSFF